MSDVTLPCEVCEQLIPMEDLVLHQSGCTAPGSQTVSFMDQLLPDCPGMAPATSSVKTTASTPTSDLPKSPDPPESHDPDQVQIPCELCQKTIPESDYTSHVESCETMEDQELRTSLTQETHFPPHLMKEQHQAIQYGLRKSMAYSKGMMGPLLSKVREMGYTGIDLKNLLEYVMKVPPVVIHVSLATLQKYLMKDTHYRSLFEVHASGGSADTSHRSHVENHLFNKFYHSCKPEDRVKYGALNLLNSGQGVASAYGYGECALVLKDEVKKRCTFTYGDSFGMQIHLGSYLGFAHILSYLDPKVLEMALKISKDPSLGEEDRHWSYPYIEAQIHGPVRLHEDIECVLVPTKYRGKADSIEILNQFATEKNCRYEWMASPSAVKIGAGGAVVPVYDDGGYDGYDDGYDSYGDEYY